MSAFRRKTALVTVFAVSALVFASIGAANAQQSDPASRVDQLAEKQDQQKQQQLQQAQEQEQYQRQQQQLQQAKEQYQRQQQQEEQEQYQQQQRRAEEIQRALAQEMEMRVRPMMRMGSFRSRAGGLAGHALAISEELELTETQQQAIRDTQRSHRRDEIRRDADIEIAELELEEMMEADTLDLDSIEAHMRQTANLQVDERMANLRLDRAVRDVLTAEQIDKLEEISPERVIIQAYQRQRNR